MAHQPRRASWRRRLRLSVRGLIVVVLVIAAGLGWIVNRARVQREAVAAIQGAGGDVAYDWQVTNGRFNPFAKPWAPRWLLDVLGVDYFGHVTDVGVGPARAQSNATMVHIGRLSRLQRLNLTAQVVTEARMVNLRGLAELSRLDLYSAKLCDAGLAHLEGLTRLDSLDLCHTDVSDAGIANLKGLTRLTSLDLRLTRVTDSGLEYLKRFPSLSVLHLASTRVTDAGLAYLRGLGALRYLNLRDTEISDAGLVYLESLSKLRELNVDGTRVTKKGMRSLQRALPFLKIYHPRARDYGPQTSCVTRLNSLNGRLTGSAAVNPDQGTRGSDDLCCAA